MFFKRKFLFQVIVLNALILTTISCNKGIGLNGLTELNVPENLSVSDITSDAAKVSWSSVENVYQYEIMYQAENFENLLSDWTYDNSIILNNLYFDNNYTVSVRAQANPNSEEYCDSEWAKVSFKTLPDVIPQDGFARPKNVNVVYDSNKKSITISWDAVEGAVYYDVFIEYKNEDSSMPALYRVLKVVPASQTSFTDTNILEKNVCVKVAARNMDFSDSCRWSKDVFLKL